MAKLRKSTISKLVGVQSTSQAFRPIDLVTRTQETFRSTTKISAATDLKKLSSGKASTFKGIQFGSPSNTGVKSRSSASAGGEWTSLVKTASGGVANLIGGGLLESGINSLISGLTNLFDGGNGKSEPPLERFALPESQQQTMFLTSEGISATAGFGAAYQSPPSQEPAYKQSEIVQAVKNALLTSCSLNDLIAEI